MDKGEQFVQKNMGDKVRDRQGWIIGVAIAYLYIEIFFTQSIGEKAPYQKSDTVVF